MTKNPPLYGTLMIINLTMKPPRTFVEVPIKEKIKYIKRRQEEEESLKDLKDFLNHATKEEEIAPINSVSRNAFKV